MCSVQHISQISIIIDVFRIVSAYSPDYPVRFHCHCDPFYSREHSGFSFVFSFQWQPSCSIFRPPSVPVVYSDWNFKFRTALLLLSSQLIHLDKIFFCFFFRIYKMIFRYLKLQEYTTGITLTDWIKTRPVKYLVISDFTYLLLWCLSCALLWIRQIFPMPSFKEFVYPSLK